MLEVFNHINGEEHESQVILFTPHRFDFAAAFVSETIRGRQGKKQLGEEWQNTGKTWWKRTEKE